MSPSWAGINYRSTNYCAWQAGRPELELDPSERREKETPMRMKGKKRPGVCSVFPLGGGCSGALQER
jgi:hypothetical protein